ncbi:MAG: S4 domain-containing protein YaaA [Vulcanibacillus sp.]
MLEIHIDGEYITLGQFLKMLGLIQSGGEAKYFLQENKVTVNNENENRRGRKLFINDIIYINDKTQYQIKNSEE